MSCRKGAVRVQDPPAGFTAKDAFPGVVGGHLGVEKVWSWSRRRRTSEHGDPESVLASPEDQWFRRGWVWAVIWRTKTWVSDRVSHLGPGEEVGDPESCRRCGTGPGHVLGVDTTRTRTGTQEVCSKVGSTTGGTREGTQGRRSLGRN